MRVHLKKLILTMSKHVFGGSDPIKVFNFLTRFINDAGIIGMSEV